MSHHDTENDEYSIAGFVAALAMVVLVVDIGYWICTI